jgi:hypothetical protein
MVALLWSQLDKAIRRIERSELQNHGAYLSEPTLTASTRILPEFHQDAGASAWDLKLASIQDGNMVP